jgi:hypothetical protein
MKRIRSIIFYTTIAATSLAAGFLLTAFMFSPAKAALVSGAGEVVQSGEAFFDKISSLAGSLSFGGGGEDSDEKFVSIPDVVVGDRKIDLGYILEKEYDISALPTAVVANLEDMNLLLYENGKVIKEIPILSKGRPGSPWETPAGKYEVLYKKENHFSSIGEVYMPSSVQFFGNFFIHGWPYYPDGTPVSEGYSGGCIRLSVEEAREVYEFVENGTPVIVYADSGEKSTNSDEYYLIDTSAEPRVDAESYLVADLVSGEVILEKARRQVRPVASITKLMTALTSLEVVNQYQTATVSAEAVATEGFAGSLSVGQRIVTGDLLYPLLLESSNDAAEVIARHYGRKYFIEQMNNKARSIGLGNTFFEDPSGLSQRNVSNAEDLFVLAQHIYKNKTHVFDVSRMKKYEGERQVWNNHSKFLELPGFIGGKNGFTDEAGKTQIVLLELPLAEFENRNIGIVLLSTDDVSKDINTLLTFLSEHVSYQAEVVTALE